MNEWDKELAAKLLKDGNTVEEVAEAVGVDPAVVAWWQSRLKNGQFEPPKRKKNNCPKCYYSEKIGYYWACCYILATEHRRPCKAADCEIWKTHPKGKVPAMSIKGRTDKKQKISKAQAKEMTALLMGEEPPKEQKKPKKAKRICENCLQEIGRDDVFCKYCGVRVEV